MRTYVVTITYPHKGNRYPRVAETTIKASSAGRAAHLAFQAAKRSGTKIREVEDSEIAFKVFIGAKSLPIQEDQLCQS
jgi:hypothetical protein